MDSEILYDEKTNGGLRINYDSQNYLYQSAKWCKLLAVIGFIFAAVLLFFAFSLSKALTFLEPVFPLFEKIPKKGISTGFFVLSLIYFFPSLFLFQFAVNIKHGLAKNNSVKLTKAFLKMKSFFMFWGIVALVILIFYVLMIASVIVGGLNFIGSLK
ncbi:hypothetical protein [Rubrolithibacter danxiaensis]|uniref:hypothetical protein n=1 Tax=Rubrolithibacter danxiaensis TaxID=3390805 RepID=UPI003BF8A254